MADHRDPGDSLRGNARGLFDLLRRGGGLLDRAMRSVSIENIRRLPGLLDQATRAITPELGVELVRDMAPVEGDRRALARVPGLLEEGKQGEAMFEALSAAPVVGGLFDLARAGKTVGRAVRGARVSDAAQEGADLKRRFTDPIREANKAGDTEEARRLTRAMIEERSLPGGFTLPMSANAREARAVGQGFHTESFHSTSALTPGMQNRLDASLSGDEFNQFNWGTHSGTKEAANQRIADQRHGIHLNQIDAAASSGEPGALAQAITNAEFPAPGERIFSLKLKGEFVTLPDLGADWSPDALMRELSEGVPSRGLGTDPAEKIFTELERDELADQISDLLNPGVGRLDRPAMSDRELFNSPEGQAAVTAAIKDKGFHGIKYRNVVEDAGSTSYVTFDPQDIRSNIAAFDPLNVDKPGMLGAATPGGVAAAGAGAGGLLGIIAAQARRRREDEP